VCPVVLLLAPGLANGQTSAPATGASGASAAVASLGLSAPNIGVSLPNIGVSVPSVGVTVVGESVSSPNVSASTPSVSASVSGEGGSSAAVTASTSPPSVSVSQPSPSAPEAPTTPVASTPPSPPSSTGEGRSPAGSPPSTVAIGPTGGATAAGTSSDLSLTPAAQAPSAGAPHAQLGATSPRQTHAVLRHRPRRALATTDRAVAIATASSDRGVVHALGAGRHPRGASQSSNPLATIGSHIPLPLPVPDWSKPIIIALLLVAIALGGRARLTGVRARRLADQRIALLADVDAMQAALVPDVPARLGGLALSVAYRPADGPAAGGDFYDVFCPQPGKVAIILGDVAGHGHDALTHAALTRYTLRAYVQARLQPRAALALAGRVLAEPTLEHYATVLVAVYDERSGCLTYASAGHPYPIMHGLAPCEPLATYSSPPIGWSVPTGCRQTTLSLTAGTIVCLYSDGLIEARCNDELLGDERLSEMLAGLGPHPDAAQLLEQIRVTATATPDDMAACIFAPDATARATPIHVEEIEADCRALARPGICRFLTSCGLSATEVTQTIARAQAIAARAGAAQLRIELAPPGTTVTVSSTHQAAPATSRRRVSEHAGTRALVHAHLGDPRRGDLDADRNVAALEQLEEHRLALGFDA
jgi:hypothetical protein